MATFNSPSSWWQNQAELNCLSLQSLRKACRSISYLNPPALQRSLSHRCLQVPLCDLKGPIPDDVTVTDNKIQRKEVQNLNPFSLEQVVLLPEKKRLWGFGRWAEMLYNTTNIQNIYNKYNTELIQSLNPQHLKVTQPFLFSKPNNPKLNEIKLTVQVCVFLLPKKPHQFSFRICDFGQQSKCSQEIRQTFL